MDNESPVNPSMSEKESIRVLLEENNRLLKEVSAGLAKVQRHIQWGRVWSLLRLLIIVVPIVLGIIYLKPYAQNLIDTYGELLGSPTSGGNYQQSLDMLEELKKYQGQ